MSGLGAVTHWEFVRETKLRTRLTEVVQADTFPHCVHISEVFTETLSPACHTAAELFAPEFGSKVRVTAARARAFLQGADVENTSSR